VKTRRRLPSANVKRQAALRARLADRFFPRLKAALREELDKQVHAAATFAARGEFAKLKSLLPEWKRGLIAAQHKTLIAIAAETYGQAGAETSTTETRRHRGQKAKTLTDARGSDLHGKAVTIGDWKHFVLENDWSHLEDWIRTTMEGAANTTAERLLRIFQHAESYWDPEKKRGLTPPEIAQRILDEGITLDEARAAMLAHTGSIWAANEGAVDRYKDDGVAVVQWLTADDDMACEFCAEMNGVCVATGDAFWSAGDELSLEGVGTMKIPSGPRGFDVRHPPLHPNCRCTLVPIVDVRQLEKHPVKE